MTTFTIPVGTASVEAFSGRPDDDADHPGVLFLADAIGLRPQIQTMVDRIASWGYVVLAPHLFFRTGTVAELAPSGDLRQPGERERFFATVGPRIDDLAPRDGVDDVAAYVEALRGMPGVAPGPVGVTGYCLGARIATRAAALHPDDIAAVGGFHGGRLVTDAEDSPHLGLLQARAEFVYGHADNDGSMPPEAVEALEAALTGAGLAHSNVIYPDAPHGYTMADTSMYQEAGAERHYAELRDLFARTL
ncbi:dienelactone hydrolase family protein [Nocardioides marmorisolisilvae]|uniref:dienelactone hydrolase family protein n=1 Tax=Nocardioides marmorisolisilvae TaxID=1542737 RepID=UPI001C84095F|nr:dienelactone hydrolase family protein [Nocardioides marmorisolisilvae]